MTLLIAFVSVIAALAWAWNINDIFDVSGRLGAWWQQRRTQ